MCTPNWLSPLIDIPVLISLFPGLTLIPTLAWISNFLAIFQILFSSEKLSTFIEAIRCKIAYSSSTSRLQGPENSMSDTGIPAVMAFFISPKKQHLLQCQIDALFSATVHSDLLLMHNGF